MADDAELWNAANDLNSAAIHLLRSLQAIDRASGLTSARLSALSVVVFGGPTTISSLARAEQVAPPTMVKVVDALCGLDLVVRQPHPHNSRMVLVQPTEHGREVMLAARERRAQIIMTAMQGLDPGARRALVRAAPHLKDLPKQVTEAQSD